MKSIKFDAEELIKSVKEMKDIMKNKKLKKTPEKDEFIIKSETPEEYVRWEVEMGDSLYEKLLNYASEYILQDKEALISWAVNPTGQTRRDD